MQRYGDLDSSQHRLKASTVGNDDVDAVAFFVFENRGRGGESEGNKAHTGQLAIVQITSEFRAVKPWRANHLEWRVGAAPDREIRGFQQTDAGIQRRFSKTAHVWRRIDPGQAGTVKPHRALPVLDFDYPNVGAQMTLLVEEASQFSDGHSMSYWNRVI